jgi:hypothetical protein
MRLLVTELADVTNEDGAPTVVRGNRLLDESQNGRCGEAQAVVGKQPVQQYLRKQVAYYAMIQVQGDMSPRRRCG